MPTSPFIDTRVPDRDEYHIEQTEAVTFLSNRMRNSSEYVNLAIIDPAYSSLEDARAVGTTTRLKNWFPVVSNDYIVDVCRLIYDYLKDNSHLYVFCDHKTMFSLVQPISDIGFVFRKPLVWDKVSIGMGYHYRCRYEFILFFEKGKRRITFEQTPDILSYKRIKSKTSYPTEKPVELIEALVINSSNPGDIILDVFMGSGSTAVAAMNWRRRFMGCDVSEESLKRTQKRINTEVVARW
jgi:site-specific DNA-methyltransferase (adenine-specific)